MTNENDIYEMEYFDVSEDKKRRKKRLTIFIAVFAVMFIWGLWLNIRPGIFVDGEFYVKKGNGIYVSGKNRVEFTEKDENEVVVEGSLNGDDFLTRLTWEDIDSRSKKITIRFDGKTYLGTWTDLTWSDTANISWDYAGMEVEGKDMTTLIYDIMEYERYEKETYLTCAIVFGKEERNSNIMEFVIGCLVYIMGVITYKIPDEIYEKLNEPWGYNSDRNVQIGAVVKYISAYVLIIGGGISIFLAIIRIM